MHTSRNKRSVRPLVPAAALGAIICSSSVVCAQSLDHLVLRLEGGLGAMLSEDQRMQGYGGAGHFSAKLGYRLTEPIAIHAGISNWYFPSARGDASALFIGGGLRFEPIVGSVGRLFADFDFGIGHTGGTFRAGFDLGVGFEVTPTNWLGIGPTIRYGRLIAAITDVPSDAAFYSINLSVTLHYPTPEPAVVLIPVVVAVAVTTPPPPPDADLDGVADADDACVSAPPGEHPDPARPGCPLRDTDADAVFDPEDRCPDEPAGSHPSRERPGCADHDSDRDGVYDETDVCRAEPAGVHPDAARAGCPLPDRDHDSVPDATDHCPDQPGAPAAVATRNGCPGLVLVANGQLRITQQVFFPPRGARILPRSFRVLQAVADVLAADPTIKHLAVEGHTDDVGDDALNLTLSQQRAETVVAWLVQHGVAAPRLEAHGFGETRPVQIPTNAAARAVNRRVEFRIGSDEAASSPPPPAAQQPTTGGQQ